MLYIYAIYIYIYICIVCIYIYVCRSQAGLIIPTLHARLELHGNLSNPSFCALYCPLPTTNTPDYIQSQCSYGILSCPLAPI